MKDFKKHINSKLYVIFPIILFILPVIILSPSIFNPDLMPTYGGDIRAHMGKISFLTEKMRISEFPLWDAYWYAGYPFYSSYPQLTYYVALPISMLTTPMFAFNIIRYLSIFILAIAVYTFVNSIVTDSRKAFLLTLFSIFNPLTFFMIDTVVIPNTLGWAFSIFFIAYFLSTKNHGKTILFGSLALLTHPYAIVFSGMALLVFLIIKKFEGNCARKFLTSFVPVFLISSFWLIPALSNIPYMSSFFENFLASDIIVLLLSIPLLLFLTVYTIRNRDDFSLWVLVMSWLCLILPLLFLFPSMFLGIRIVRLCYPFFLTLLIAVNIKNFGRYGKIFNITLALVLLSGLAFTGIHTWSYSVHEPDPVLEYVDNTYRIMGIEFPTMEADSFLTFAAENDMMSFTGPFNQGDPKFDSLTYIPEWEWWKMLENPYLMRNIMQESFSKYVYYNNEIDGFNSTIVLESHPINKQPYYIMELQEPVYYALSVSPILLYSDRKIIDEIQARSDVGYKFVFVDRVYEKMNNFEILLTDELSKLSDTEKEEKTILLYHYDGRIEYENKNYSLENLEYLFSDLGLKYSPVEWERQSTENIIVSSDEEFILVKESWHPGWNSLDADIINDKNGFMLLIPNNKEIRLNFHERFLFHGIIVSMSSLIILYVFRKKI